MTTHSAHDVLDDFVSELKVLLMALSNTLMPADHIFEFIRAIVEHVFSKLKANGKLFEVNYFKKD